jgi:hypothetical protein
MGKEPEFKKIKLLRGEFGVGFVVVEWLGGGIVKEFEIAF